MDIFQPGDVVCLKSGGPDMTVELVEVASHSQAVVTCVWFIERTLYRASLPASALCSAMWPLAA